MIKIYRMNLLVFGKYLFLVFSVIAFASSAQKKPNIVVFIADDAGMEYGCYGFEGATTPNIDKLANEGLKFTNAFLTTSSCSPSRTSMLSGQYAHTIGTEDLHTGINDTTLILPAYLKEAGYYTGFMLKGHFGQNAEKQFDWSDNGFYPDWVVEGTWNKKALGNFQEFLNEAGERPFFMWLGFVDPHRPYRDAEKVEGNRAPEVNDPKKVHVPPYLVDDEITRKDLAHYYDEITNMDAHIGRMMEELDNRNLLENTLVVFLSDNGKPFPRAKGTCYDSGIHTPLIVSWKGKIPAEKEYNGLTSIINLAPTILDVAGLSKPDHMVGRSLVPVFQNQNLPGDEYVFAERNWHGGDEHIRAIRTDEYLLIMNSYAEWPHSSPTDLSTSPSWYSLKQKQKEGKITSAQQWLFNYPRPMIELYDVKKDPYQINNLSGRQEYLETSNRLTKQLVDWMKETGDHPSHKRRKADVLDRYTGYPIKGDRKFFTDDFWD